MAYYYVVETAASFGPTVTIDGQVYRVTAAPTILLDDDKSRVLIDPERASNLTIDRTSALSQHQLDLGFNGSTSNAETATVTIESSYISTTMTVDDGAQVNWNIDAGHGHIIKINIGDHARFGNIKTGAWSDTVASGTNSHIGDVNTWQDADHITIGGSAGTIYTNSGADTVVIGPGATVTGDLATGFTGATHDADFLEIGNRAQALGFIDTYDGKDTVAVGTHATIGKSINTYIGDDTIVIGATDICRFDHFLQVPCFTRGTLIETEIGPVAIETLKVGDLVLTRDNGLQPIRWIGARCLSAEDLVANEKLYPVRIRRHALGTNIPSADLLVSPQHRILIRSKIAQKMFSTPEILVAAKQLCQMEGIDIARDLTEVEYLHVMFDRHEVVISNGAETESLYAGADGLEAVGPAARQELFTLFPELRDESYQPTPARMLVPGRAGRKLVVRHVQNRKALVSAAV